MTRFRIARYYTILRKRKLGIFLTLIAVAALAVLLGFARSSKPAQAAPPVLEVEVVKVEQQSVPIYSEWIGTTEGMVNAEIKAQVTGYLLRQDYKEGSFVKKGQLLFEIDPRPFQAAVDQAKGQVAQYQGQLAQAGSQITQAEAELAQANSQLSQAQAAPCLCKLNVDLVHSLREATKATALPLRVLKNLDQLESRVFVGDDDTWSGDEMLSLSPVTVHCHRFRR